MQLDKFQQLMISIQLSQIGNQELDILSACHRSFWCEVAYKEAWIPQVSHAELLVRGNLGVFGGSDAALFVLVYQRVGRS